MFHEQLLPSTNTKACRTDEPNNVFPVKHNTNTNTNVFVNDFVNKPSDPMSNTNVFVNDFVNKLLLRFKFKLKFLTDNAMKLMENTNTNVFVNDFVNKPPKLPSAGELGHFVKNVKNRK